VTTGLWRVNDVDLTVYCCWLWAQSAGTRDVYLLCNDYASDFNHTFLRPFRVTVIHPPTHSYRLPTPQRTPDVGPSPAVSGSAFSARQLRLGRRPAWLFECRILQCQHRGRPCDTLICIPVIVPITSGVLRPSVWWYGRHILAFVISFRIMLVLLSSKYVITPLNCWKIACDFEINEKYTFRVVYV
jgi:hypothetical protein